MQAVSTPVRLLVALVGVYLAKAHADGQQVVNLPGATVVASPVAEPLPSSDSSFSSIKQEIIQEGTLRLGLDEPLGALPGVFILNPYNFAQDSRIAIRGFGARADFGIRGIRLYVDGIPLTTTDGQGEVDSIDLASAA